MARRAITFHIYGRGTMSSLAFNRHGRRLQENLYVYAVMSRRAGGLSLGVNLSPDKACNLACLYCQVDRTTPGRAFGVDIGRLGSELEDLLARAGTGILWRDPPFRTVDRGLRRVVDVAFAGDGEPTAAPEFPEAARAAREVRDGQAFEVPLRLLTNATMFEHAGVHAALVHFDELWCKLDAGTEARFQLVNGTRLRYARVLANLLRVGRERPIVVQSLFPALGGAGPTDAEVDAYVGRLRNLVAGGAMISRVQVYTIARPPADVRVAELPLPRLGEIASQVRALGIPVEVHGAPAPASS
jgi:wyosine [tRNA(Phe)-imidazoG37] synthetase (radical SAM superfamily)